MDRTNSQPDHKQRFMLVRKTRCARRHHMHTQQTHITYIYRRSEIDYDDSSRDIHLWPCTRRSLWLRFSSVRSAQCWVCCAAARLWPLFAELHSAYMTRRWVAILRRSQISRLRLCLFFGSSCLLCSLALFSFLLMGLVPFRSVPSSGNCLWIFLSLSLFLFSLLLFSQLVIFYDGRPTVCLCSGKRTDYMVASGFLQGF